jgi:hypothetical protein
MIFLLLPWQCSRAVGRRVGTAHPAVQAETSELTFAHPRGTDMQQPHDEDEAYIVASANAVPLRGEAHPITAERFLARCH